MKRIFSKTDFWVLFILLGMTVILLTEMVFSLSWRSRGDVPVIRYVAYCIDHFHFVPYKDVFYTNLPGAIGFHILCSKWLGYSDFALRITDLAWLSGLLFITWRIMRRFGRLTGLAAPLIMGLIYLSGPGMNMQRDYLGILPIAAAVLLVLSDVLKGRPLFKAYLAGILFGVAASFKPHLLIGLPAVILHLHFSGSAGIRKTSEHMFRMFLSGFLALLGAAASASVPFIWLWRTGGLPHFWDMFHSYLPLHVQMVGNHVILLGKYRALYLLDNFQKLGGHQMLLMPAVLGAYLIFSETKKGSSVRSSALLMLSLLVVYGLYPVFSGQFWAYHWVPYIYFGSCCAAWILFPQPQGPKGSLVRALFPAAVFVFFTILILRPSPDFNQQVRGLPPIAPNEGRVDEISQYLTANLKPGDTVQPLDWVGGGSHNAMLKSGVKLATPFVYDYHFYHHVSHPVNRKLRAWFMSSLQEARPAFIIEMPETIRPTGYDTSREFLELRKFIRMNYRKVVERNGYIIYERNGK